MSIVSMMRCLFYVPLWLFCMADIVSSQNIQRTADVRQQMFPWGKAEYALSNNVLNVRFIVHKNIFADAVHDPAVSQHLPVYTCFIPSPSQQKISVRVQRQIGHQTVSDRLPDSSLAMLSALVRAEAGKPSILLDGYRWYRGKRFAQICISPYTMQSGSMQSLDTIDVSVQYTAAKDAPSSMAPAKNDHHFQSAYDALVLNSDEASGSMDILSWADSTRAWLPQNNRAIKLTIAHDGIYRLTFTGLTNLLPEISLVRPESFRLINKGQELPLSAHLNTPGIFASGDYIEFIGLRNYRETSYRSIPQPKEEYPEYLNRYTDTSYYWLTWNGADGLRFHFNDTTGAAADTVNWYTERIHLEQNNNYAYIGSDQVEQQNPYWTSGDMWGWSYLFANQNFAIPFSASFMNTEHPYARIIVKAMGSAANSGVSPAHLLQAGVNSYVAPDTTSLNQFQQTVLQREIPLTAFTSDNALHVYSHPSASSTNSIMIDWADVEYSRTLIVSGDSLWFGFSDLSGSAVRTVVIQGMTTPECLIYKLKNTPKKITGLQVSGSGPYSFTFVDTVSNGDRYVIMSASKVQSPPMSVRNNFSAVRDTVRQADYLLISNTQFPGIYSLAQPYANFIQQTYGLAAAVIDVRDIYDEFGYGYPVPESIREFLKSTTRWISPMPSYVFLAGRPNYDFKNYVSMAGGGHIPNIVPAYGMPISDPWLALLDDSLNIPQMYIGRLPVLNEEEFQRYFDHVQAYVSAPYDDWNKKYMFFAGGESQGEISSFHSVHQNIIRSIVRPAPVGGRADDFYKTVNPQSDYGPYTQKQFTDAVDSGAVIISYIGHSGTQTWDNNIADAAKLQNARGRFALMCDFGCSTAKYAEPNIRAFGELFTTAPDGSAIGYVGNSSLGFTSIATMLPGKFFSTILTDTVHEIGKAHLTAKIAVMTQYGLQNSSMGRQLMLTNTLVGDPALVLAIPKKPNMSIDAGTISGVPVFPSDDEDSVQLTFPYYNFGSVPADSVQIQIRQTYTTAVADTLFTRAVPSYSDSVVVTYPIRNRPGTYQYAVQLNPLRLLDEIYYSDNTSAFSTVVQTVSFRGIYPVPGLYCPSGKFSLLNPMKQSEGEGNNVVLEIDTLPTFISRFSLSMPYGNVVTKYALPALGAHRYYWRAFAGQSDTAAGSFIPSNDSLFRWTQTEPDEWLRNSYSHTIADSSGIHLVPQTYAFHLVSSGFLTGRYGAIEINGSNIIGSTFNRGITAAYLDSMDFHVIQSLSFDTFGGSSGGDTSYGAALVNFLNTLPQNSTVALIAIDEASNSLTAYTRSVIREFGSRYINQLGWRDPWAMIGRKGALPGTVPEGWALSTDSLRVSVDTNIVRPGLYGEVLSSVFGPVSKWIQASIEREVPEGSSAEISVLGKNSLGTFDTVVSASASETVWLDSVDASKYSSLRLLAKLRANGSGISPRLKNWQATLLPPPELAVNYQCITLTEDSVLEGSVVPIPVRIYNAGEQPAHNVQVLFTCMNGGIRQQDTLVIPAVPADSYSTLSYVLSTAGKRGMNTIFIQIDPAQHIAEPYEMNNVYSFAFFVRTDTTQPNFEITFDGKRIFDNDFVLARPAIHITLQDNSPLLLTDPSRISVALNGRRISLGLDTPDSLFVPQDGSTEASVTFRPVLGSGEHVLDIQASDQSGNFISGQIRFRVETESNLLDVVNYPNPFANETYFTFQLVGSEIPEEVKIKIYTIAGRHIHTIVCSPAELAAGFNKIFWDGKDHDGDAVANGVYLYKVLMKSGAKNSEVIQKLVRLR